MSTRGVLRSRVVLNLAELMNTLCCWSANRRPTAVGRQCLVTHDNEHFSGLDAFTAARNQRGCTHAPSVSRQFRRCLPGAILSSEADERVRVKREKKGGKKLGCSSEISVGPPKRCGCSCSTRCSRDGVQAGLGRADARPGRRDARRPPRDVERRVGGRVGGRGEEEERGGAAQGEEEPVEQPCAQVPVRGGGYDGHAPGRGLPSSTFQLNLNRFRHCLHPSYPQKVLKLSRNVYQCVSPWHADTNRGIEVLLNPIYNKAGTTPPPPTATRRRHAFRTRISLLKWRSMTWRALSARPAHLNPRLLISTASYDVPSNICGGPTARARRSRPRRRSAWASAASRRRATSPSRSRVQRFG